MSVFDKDNPEGIYPVLVDLEERFHLPKGFCEGLLNEDDWSFVIKLHALLEATLTALLVEKMGDNRLHTVVSEIEMSRAGTGKVAFAQALGVLEKQDRRFIAVLSELRNQLVHRIENVSFDLKKYVAEVDHQKRDALTKAFLLWTGDDKRDFAAARKYVTQSPKGAMWESGVYLVALLAAITENINQKRIRDDLLQGFGQFQAEAMEQSKTSLASLARLFRDAQSAGETPEG